MTDGDSGLVDYGMFSDAGNAAVGGMVKAAKVMVGAGEPEATVLQFLYEETLRLGRAGFTEVRDTMVREAIAVELDEAWVAAYGHGRVRKDDGHD